jgi:hypothetical protein
VEHNKAENCFIAAIATGSAVLMKWFCVVVTLLCRRIFTAGQLPWPRK